MPIALRTTRHSFRHTLTEMFYICSQATIAQSGSGRKYFISRRGKGLNYIVSLIVIRHELSILQNF